MKFELTPEQLDQIDKWYANLKPTITDIQYSVDASLTVNGKVPYYGAIGGGLTYTFTPTGLGMIVQVKELITGEELDVTPYDDW